MNRSPMFYICSTPKCQGEFYGLFQNCKRLMNRARRSPSPSGRRCEIFCAPLVVTNSCRWRTRKQPVRKDTHAGSPNLNLNLSDPPDPHPLDYDWRFSDEAVDRIRELIPRDATTLAVGTPSIARYLEREGRQVTLVDRQPFQGVRNQLPIDVYTASPLRQSFDFAVIDPPWYPKALRYWLAWTAKAVRRNGTILAVVWPTSTRPSAPEEYVELQQWISSWGALLMPNIALKYKIPLFEQVAGVHANQHKGSRSPGIGNLFEIHVDTRPELPLYLRKPGYWSRFVLNDYQLALRFSGASRAERPLEKHPLANDWTWPFVSRRALGRTQIGLWSSENEVAVVSKPEIVSRAIRKAIKSRTRSEFEAAFAALCELREWDIPHPPYWRSAKWQHPL